jgi:hypothetical protein
VKRRPRDALGGFRRVRVEADEDFAYAFAPRKGFSGSNTMVPNPNVCVGRSFRADAPLSFLRSPPWRRWLTSISFIAFGLYVPTTDAIALRFAESAQAIDANWGIVLDAAAQTGAPGSTVSYSGRIVNDTGTALLIDSSALSFSASSQAFFDFAEAFIDTLGVIPIGGYSGSLFFVAWADTVSPGTLGTGTLTLSVGSPGNPRMLLVAFSSNIPDGLAAPEPAMLMLLCASLLAWTATGKRTR